MEGRWLYEKTNRQWMKILGYVSGTSMTLETNYIKDSITGAEYIIGESPDIPDTLHHFIPFKVGGVYISTIRKNPNEGQKLLNYYWTGDPNNFKREGKIFGGVLGAIKRLRSRGGANEQIINRGSGSVNFFEERWKTVLS
jgi:hypothetical protein